MLLLAAVAGGALAAHPTGVAGIDAAWCALFVAALAYCGGYTPRLTALVLAGAASVLAGTTLSLGLAGAAVVAAAVNASFARASLRWSTAGGGLIGLSLLTGSGPDDATLAAVTTTVVAGALVVAGLRGMTRSRRRWALRIVYALGGVVVVCAAAGIVAALRVRADIDAGVDAFRAAQVEATGGDLQSAVGEFRQAERELDRAAGPLRTFGRIGRLVPVLSQQLGATDTAVEAAGDAATAARRTSSSIDLDAVGLANGAVDLAALDAARGPMGGLVDVLVGVIDRLEHIDRELLVGPVSDALDEAIEEARDAGATAERLHRALELAPDLLGAQRPVRYLVIFTSPVEARNRIGFPGSYAVLAVEGGRIAFESAGPIGDIDPGAAFDQLAVEVPPRAQPYLAYGLTRQWRSVTLPVHAPAAASVAVQLAAQTPVGLVDGVVFAGPETLAAIVGLVGDVPLDAVDATLTPLNTVEFLTSRQYLEFPQLGDQRDRKDLLGDVAQEVGARFPFLSLPRAQDLADVFGPLVERGDLIVSVPATLSPDAADLLGDVGLDGAFPHPGDEAAEVLYVGQVNSVGNKIDLFLQRTLVYDVAVADDGALSADLTIELANDAPGSGLPFYLIGSALVPAPPPGTNLTTTLIYSRHELETLTVDGVAVVPPVFFEGGFFVYQVYVELGPGQRRTIQAHLEGEATAPGPQEVLVYPNGLLRPDEVHVRVRDARFGTEGDGSATVREVTRVVAGR